MCRKKSIECIVAPYEADAQLAYLNKIGVAEVVITEDSDLVLFGCNKILFKMDSCGGGILYEKENLPKSFGPQFSFEKFRYMCILSGCDYLPSLPGIGLAKACKFFMLTSNTDLSIVLSKLPSYLKMPKLIVTEEYKESFIKANNTFLYQLVFCPKKKTLVPLNTYPEGCNINEMEYAGTYLPDELARQLAMGNINVKTLKKFDSISDNCSFDMDDSGLWGTNEKKPVPKKEISAFKFTSPKAKSLPVKRKHEELILEKKETKPLIDEELLSMYGGSKPEECDDKIDTSDEDPIPSPHRKKSKISCSQAESPSCSSTPCKNISNLSLQKIVKSRFFVKNEGLKSVTTSVTNVTPLETGEQGNQVSDSKSCNSNLEQVVQENSESEISYSFDLSSPKKCNKENINRFAKKKVPEFNPEKSFSSTLDLASTPSSNAPQKSLFDVIDSESSVSSVTSCEKIAGKACEILCETSKSFKDNIGNKFSSKLNEKKFKLVSTKILDFKLTKESDYSAKLNHSLGSDGNTSYESLPESDSLLLEESSFSPVHEDNEQIVSDSGIEKDITSSSDNKNIIEIDISDSKTSSEYFSTVKPKLLCTKGKSSKCRQIGLSKNRKHKEQKVSKKETLLNFNFVRKPKSEVEILV